MKNEECSASGGKDSYRLKQIIKDGAKRLSPFAIRHSSIFNKKL